jgi:hypothetical protein
MGTSDGTKNTFVLNPTLFYSGHLFGKLKIEFSPLMGWMKPAHDPAAACNQDAFVVYLESLDGHATHTGKSMQNKPAFTPLKMSYPTIDTRIEEWM